MALADKPYLSSLWERDIDFLLLEEFHSEPAFVRWFVSTATGRPLENVSSFDGAWRSVSNAALGGESDLLVLASLADQKHALLIENKIDAIAQPDQGLRYF